MSASPSGMSAAATPTSTGGPTPNGAPPRYIRRPKPADPLVARKKPVRRTKEALIPLAAKQNGPPRPGNPASNTGVNGLAAMQASLNGSNFSKSNGGWTRQPGPNAQAHDFPLFTTKRAFREGLKYHIARFSSKKEIDPTNQGEFTRPVSLHRRDPRQPPAGKGVKLEEKPVEEPIDSKEREKQEILKAEKDARRAADLAQIAPTGNNASAMASKKNHSFRNEKTTQVFRLDETEEDKKRSDLRYEEALPWHLEDSESKNTWVGNYEAALSETNVIFVIEGSSFKMIPVDKWYKFTAKNQFKTLTIEEAEAAMSKRVKESRWAMRTHELQEADRAKWDTSKQLRNLYTVKAESSTFKNSRKAEHQDMDDLDFAADDLFQDDDEQATFEPDNDEDAKDAQERIKREQLGANIFGQANEADVDNELDQEEKEAEDLKKLGKGVKKALTKREKNYIYESDSDHPYSSSSEDDTSDEEKQKEIDRRKDEEAKNKAKLAATNLSKGSTTPSGRPKVPENQKKSKALKRPGSPNLSESSGNESSRKKHKKKHVSSSQPTGTSAQIPGSRLLSPAPSSSSPAPGQSPQKSSIVKLNLNPSKLSEIQSVPPNPSALQGGATSDGDATGGEMSDGAGGKKKKIKLRVSNSVTGSRAGSPAAGRSGSVGASRAGSPSAQSPKSGMSRAGSPSLGNGPIQPHEITSALPPEGIAIGNLMKLFGGRVGELKGQQTSQKEFIQLVKENSSYGRDKLLRPKVAA